MNRAEVVIVDKEHNVSYKIQAEQTPRKTEPGVYLYLKINQIGMQHLQNSYDVNDFVSTKSFEKWFMAKTGMPETGLGSLGNLKSEEGRNNWEISVAGDVAGALVGEVMEVAEPMVATIPADTTNPMIAQIQKYRKEGKINDDTIKAGLVEKVGKESAEQLWNAATEVKVEKGDLF